MALNLEKQLLFVRSLLRFNLTEDADSSQSMALIMTTPYGHIHSFILSQPTHRESLGQYRDPYALRSYPPEYCFPPRERSSNEQEQVWALTITVQGTNTPPLVPMPGWLVIPNLPSNLGTVACLIYATLYILMEPVAGGMLAPLMLAGTAFANHLTSTYGQTANYWALGLHVASWIAQFIGHGAFEGRAPALLDNLVQAFFLAPFFVWMEFLFRLGYRPELKRRLDSAVEKEVQKYRQSKTQRNRPIPNGKANGSAT
ncbi:MAG: hypothetical protein Q9182_001250 [Xanthomendoza sp. 2 TL-2023]